MIAWTIFYHPIYLDGHGSTLWLLLPLCLSVALTYKTIRLHSLRRLHLAVLALMIYMIAGLVALGLGLWAIQTFLP